MSFTEPIHFIRILEETLLSIASNPNFTDNTRADALDTVARLSEDATKQQVAREGLGLLGRQVQAGNPGEAYLTSSVYANKQNVHTSDVEAFVDASILKLVAEFPEPLDFEVLISLPFFLTVESCVSRIRLDKGTYSGITLKKLLCLVWAKLSTKEETDEDAYKTLRDKLAEEMVEMTPTCSTGYATRLVNTLTGGFFEGYELQFSVKTILKNLFAEELNKHIKASPLCDELLGALMSPERGEYF